MYRRIVAPLDGSGLAECSLDEVRLIAGAQTQLDLISVLTPLRVRISAQLPPGLFEDVGVPPRGGNINDEAPPVLFDDINTRTAIERVDEASERAATAYLDKVAGKFKKKDLKVKTEVLAGQPAEEIVAYADRVKADLIAISTHGRSGPSRWAFGSVADKVLRTARIPVLMITPAGCRLEE
jgi:nucleotide-binding universal stress UspA family protein